SICSRFEEWWYCSTACVSAFLAEVFKIMYLNAIQTNAHHLIRYLATAVVVNKRRRNMLKELIKVIQQEHHSYKDPVTEFLECLYVNYDFDGAQQKLIECEQGSLNELGSWCIRLQHRLVE
ncbi:hypothetical protein ACJX0J_042372, partial [Zea mays]